MLYLCHFRPPNGSIVLFNEYIANNILSKLAKDSNVFMCGDLTLDLYNPRNLISINYFIDEMLNFKFYTIVRREAKINYDGMNTNYTLIDHIWCNFWVGTFHKSRVLTYRLSNQFPIFHFFKFRFVNMINKIDLDILMKRTKQNLFMKYQT